MMLYSYNQNGQPDQQGRSELYLSGGREAPAACTDQCRGADLPVDANGNLFAPLWGSLVWDQENRLANITQGTYFKTYLYDAEHQRRTKTVNNNLTTV